MAMRYGIKKKRNEDFFFVDDGKKTVLVPEEEMLNLLVEVAEAYARIKRR